MLSVVPAPLSSSLGSGFVYNNLILDLSIPNEIVQQESDGNLVVDMII